MDKCPTPEFDSGHDLVVNEFERHIRLGSGSADPAWDSLALKIKFKKMFFLFPVFFLKSIFDFILWLGNMLDMISNFLNLALFLRLNTIYFGKCPMCSWKVCIPLVIDGMAVSTCQVHLVYYII